MQILCAIAQPVQWIWILNFTFFLFFHGAIVFGEIYLPTVPNAAQDVFFSKDLSLERTGNIGREDYKDVIVYLRQRLLGKRYFDDNPKSPLAHTWYSHNLPVLRPQLPVSNENRVPLFELVVQTPKKNRVTFKLRRDNLFVVGYQTGNKWWEFQPDKKDGKPLPPLIRNSILLPFGGGYPSIEDYSKITLGKTLIGQQNLIKAVDNLVPTTTTDEVRAQSLLVVIFMISESTRFRNISDFIAKNYLASVQVDSYKEHPLSELVKDWDKLSAALLRVDAGEKFYITEPHDKCIKKEPDAVAVLGILKYTSFRKKSNDAKATSTLSVPLSTA